MHRRPKVVVLGGTFDGLHPGHRALLEAAFGAAQEVGIGLTTPGFLADHPKRRARSIRPYARRRRELLAYLRRRFPGRRYRVLPLSDPFGGSVAPGVDLLVASAETREGARAVNVERRRRGLAPLKLLLVPLVLADDLLPVSSSRVRVGAIDREGRRLRPVRMGLVGLPTSADDPLRHRMGQLLPTSQPLSLERVASPRPRGPPRVTAVGRAALAALARDYGVGAARVPVGSGGWWVAFADASGPLGSPFRIARGEWSALERGVHVRLRPRRRAWKRNAPETASDARGSARKRKVI